MGSKAGTLRHSRLKTEPTIKAERERKKERKTFGGSESELVASVASRIVITRAKFARTCEAVCRMGRRHFLNFSRSPSHQPLTREKLIPPASQASELVSE